jgi:hypothetical protein
VALDVEAEDLFCGRGRVIRVVNNLDAASFASPTHFDLGFDDDGSTELLGGRSDFVRGVGDDAGKYWHSIRLEEVPGLIFE